MDLMSHSTSAGISSSLVLYTCLMVVVSKPLASPRSLGSFSTCSLLLHPWRLWPDPRRVGEKKDDPTFPAYQSLVVSKISQIPRRRAAAENRRHGMFSRKCPPAHDSSSPGAGRGGIHVPRSTRWPRSSGAGVFTKVRIFGESWSARIASVGGETFSIRQVQAR